MCGEVRRFAICLIFGVFQFLASTPCRAADAAPVEAEDLFRDGDTIVFFGDSITQGGLYIDHFEAFLLCLYPERRFRVLNRGISSETISGTSETDHDPRRPWAHERFTRDIASLKPNVLIACFGMNDGNYHPFEWTRFEKYQRGIRRLIERAQDEAGVRTLILMTPPPYDPYQRKAGDPNAREYGYRYAAIDYDDTLAHYGDWLLSLRDEGRIVVDLHGPLNEHVWHRRQEQVSFTLAPDAVHPNMTGHWLMALQMIRDLGLGPELHEFVFDQPVESDSWEGTATLRGFAPIDPQVDARSIHVEELDSASDGRFILRWMDLPSDQKFRLTIDGIEIGQFAGAELAEMVPIPANADLPIMQRRMELLAKIRERRSLEYWQFRSQTDKPLGNKPPAADIPARIAELTAEIETLRQPVECRIRLQVVR